jgi:hypothetical protein
VCNFNGVSRQHGARAADLNRQTRRGPSPPPLVLACEGPGEGWWEPVVLKAEADLFTLKWPIGHTCCASYGGAGKG